MTNQQLQEQLKLLKEMVATEKNELALREKWVKEANLKIQALEYQIENTENVLKEEAGN